MSANNSHITPQFRYAVAPGQSLADVSMLAFRDDPETFISGSLHNHLPRWEQLASLAPYKDTPTIIHWIRNSVDVHDFFQLFVGSSYKGNNFNSVLPPSCMFPNPPSCKYFAQFISDTITNRMSTGAISVWGQVARITSLPRYVRPFSYQTLFVTTSQVMITWFSPQAVARILVSNGEAGILLVIHSLLAGNLQPIFIIPLVSLRRIIFALYAFRAHFISTITILVSSCYLRTH